MELHILIDSSTHSTSSGDKYGESVAAWAAWWSNDLENKPIRCGIHYFRREGPNKCFYQGVIRALESCLSMSWGSEVIVYGDCESVLKQLRGEWAVKDMTLEYRQVKALIKKFEDKGSHITFQYRNESDREYKNIDQLAKRSHHNITSILQRNKAGR